MIKEATILTTLKVQIIDRVNILLEIGLWIRTKIIILNQEKIKD